MRSVVIISDLQMPFEDRRALKNVLGFIKEYQPDEVIQIGDLMDYPQPSRWSKDTRAEFEGSVFRDSEYGIRNFVKPLRDVYDGPVKVIEGNHDCLDTDTKLVTRRGIIDYTDVVPGDEILTVNDDGNSVWTSDFEVVEYDYDGEMVVYESGPISMRVTPNHRVVGLDRRTGAFTETYASNLKPMLILQSGKNTNPEYPISDNHIRLTARLLTNRVRPEHAGELDDLIGGNRNRVPDWVYQLSSRQFKIFLDTWVHTDGTTFSSGVRTVYVSRDELRRDLLLLLAINGERAYTTEHRPGHWRVNIGGLPAWMCSGGYKGSTEKYKGKVWCLRVPKYERFMVFRDRSIYLTGNSRPREYLEKYAPALAESKAFHLETLLKFDEYNIEIIRGFYDIAPDWVVTHGHLGLPLSQLAGRSAMRAANKIGKSVIQGHTHRLGVSAETYGYQGKTYTRWGVEVGNLMDIRKADYLKSGSANWQQGFAIIHIEGSRVYPELIPVQKDGSFMASGKLYGGKGSKGNRK